jgi:Secretion system C-terminal sorting domain
MRCMARNKFIVTVAWVFCFSCINAQFAPVAALPGSTAIRADSACFVQWATGCTVQRGFMNIADTALGFASAGTDTDGLGPADKYTVSLGDGGVATLSFNDPIYNGDGFDFAVFENGFMTNDSNLAFLELAFVEVSSDGVRFVRFPAVSHVEDSVQTGSFSSTDGSLLYNLAGKYIAGYGTPFDLQELVDSPGIDVNNIRYVRVVDVVGSIDPAYATHDSKGNIVNDPWPTPFASSGFDLDAVGVINAKLPGAIAAVNSNANLLYPNPVKQGNTVFMACSEPVLGLKIYDINGRLVKDCGAGETAFNRVSVKTDGLDAGIYFMRATTARYQNNLKLVVE